MGKYTAKWGLIESRPTGKVHYVEDGPNHGTINKQNNEIREMKICPHVVRTIEDWASHKAKFQRNPQDGTVTLKSKLNQSLRDEPSVKRKAQSVVKNAAPIDPPT